MGAAVDRGKQIVGDGGGRRLNGETSRVSLQLRCTDVDPDEVGHGGHGSGGVHIVVGWPQFGAQRQHHVGVGDQGAHGLKARAGRDAQRMLVQQTPGVDGLHHRRIEPLGQRLYRLRCVAHPTPGEDHHALRCAQLFSGEADAVAIIRQRRRGLRGPRIVGCEGRSGDIQRDFDVAGAGPDRRAGLKGVSHHRHHIRGGLDALGTQRHQPRDAPLIGQFVQKPQPPAEARTGIDPGDDDHGH